MNIAGGGCTRSGGSEPSGAGVLACASFTLGIRKPCILSSHPSRKSRAPPVRGILQPWQGASGGMEVWLLLYSPMSARPPRDGRDGSTPTQRPGVTAVKEGARALGRAGLSKCQLGDTAKFPTRMPCLCRGTVMPASCSWGQ